MTTAYRIVVPRKPSWAAFFGWFAVGACAVLGVMTVFTIGWMILLLGVLVTLLLLRSGRGLPPLAGLVAGAGIPFLVVAILNRKGPGTVCTSTANGSECIDEFNPWPLVVAGIALLAIGIGIFGLLRRRSLSGASGKHPAPNEPS